MQGKDISPNVFLVYRGIISIGLFISDLLIYLQKNIMSPNGFHLRNFLLDCTFLKSNMDVNVRELG